MQTLKKQTNRRRSINLTADAELVSRVRQEGGNLSALLDESMKEFLKRKELERWKEENRASFESYNRMIEETGLISDDLGVL
ncbi:type II toxin-antitoxin system CcdA family antitoxin [Geomonas sp. Red32]|uniref:type II toxin-antitoxin system CcdA family antitoxin n=1 Tax=Geomonas sp. Red32 TaxID=2912856 RepID=UPI00202CBC03|nr:type II toxin-antitoxin system CcdA family antitoxin [Geomonas sp. Red32]MCM0083725.1 type II toxin-antitoxin system CcdA family antitoxin [Geomonas sp. Red32]